MKAYVISAGGTSLDDLNLVERDQPEAGPGQIKVRVRACSLNYRDLAIVAGIYGPGPLGRDTVPLSDGAGEVVAVGQGVTRFTVGDRVAGIFFPDWHVGAPSPERCAAQLGGNNPGMLAEYVTLGEGSFVSIPEHLSFEQAATLPCAGVTAWHALMVRGRVKPGDTVLTLGTGGVSIFALQFAKAAGARVIITSSSEDKIKRAKQLGADEGVNYAANPEWQDQVLALTGGQGVDQIVELGGAGTLGRSVGALRMGGRIMLIGVLTGGGEFNPIPLMLKCGDLCGTFVGSREMFEDMNAAITTNGLKPVIDKTFPFEDAKAAYAYQQSAAHLGKIVITV